MGRPVGLVRRHGWLAVFAAAIVVVGVAQAATATKRYHVEIAGTTAVAGTTESYALTLTNSADSTHTLGSANVAVPTEEGFSVVEPALGDTLSVTASDGLKQWAVTHAATPSGPVLQYRALTTKDALANGEYVTAGVDVHADCDAETAAWVTKAKQANSFSGPPGNDFLRDVADPELTVTAGGSEAVALVFTTQPPARSQKNEVMAPAITVTAIDACEEPATQASGNVTIDIGDDPSGGTAGLDGTLSQPLEDGVATFDDLSIDTSGDDYTLAAEHAVDLDTTLSDESDPFDIVDVECTKLSLSCVTQDATTRVEVPVPNGDGTVALSLGVAKAQTSPCGGGGNAVGSWATIDPEPDAYTAALTTVKLTYSKEAAPGTGVANFVVCFGKPGTSGIAWTQLLDCGKSPKQSAPCISKRNRTGVGELVVELLIPSADPIGGTYT